MKYQSATIRRSITSHSTWILELQGIRGSEILVFYPGIHGDPRLAAQLHALTATDEDKIVVHK